MIIYFSKYIKHFYLKNKIFVQNHFLLVEKDTNDLKTEEENVVFFNDTPDTF